MWFTFLVPNTGGAIRSLCEQASEAQVQALLFEGPIHERNEWSTSRCPSASGRRT
jgi:hypothetical protein